MKRRREGERADLEAGKEFFGRAAYIEERSARANPARARRVLARAGRGNPPLPGDELPPKARQKR